MKSEKVYTYLLSTGLMIITLMVLSVFCIVIVNGAPHFWPKKVSHFVLKDGREYLGEIHGKELTLDKSQFRYRIKIGNRDVYGQDYVWIDEDQIVSRAFPHGVIMLERMEWGNAYGFIPEKSITEIKTKIKEATRLRKRIVRFEKKNIAGVYADIEAIQKKYAEEETAYRKNRLSELEDQYRNNEQILEELYIKAQKETFRFSLIDKTEKEMRCFDIVHATAVNDLSIVRKAGVFIYRIGEFIFSYPRESNTEGGVFPALFGTVFLVLIMSVFVFPFGVIAAVYLHEYARHGIILKLVRITIFNLAGVPSIVYGVFGLGFFIYTVGGGVDAFFFSDNLPSPTFGTGGILWASLTMAILTLPVVVVASMEGLKSVPQMYRDGAYGLAATKWEVIKDVVIPNAMPGMLTGLILAISRAAGEVAPLMITGVVKLALSLPADLTAPFVHLERKFMHLGFHIYDVGFQSPNVEASRPMVFNTTLLLLAVVFVLNLTAIIIRNKLRKKFLRSGV